MRPLPALRPAAPAVLLALAGAAIAQPAAPCAADLADALRVQGARHVVAFAPRPAPWASGRHFALDIVVCPGAEAPPPDRLRVDARMPAHGHGMNYRPTLVATGPGRWRAEGLMLHMAGRWELLFELHQGGEVERLRHALDLR